jgi:hypothetical protein
MDSEKIGVIKMKKFKFNTVEDAIKAIKAGKDGAGN